MRLLADVLVMIPTKNTKVLILILLEMRLLVEEIEDYADTLVAVLILILLEMRLLVYPPDIIIVASQCLNPYSTGNEVVGKKKQESVFGHKCLNPYSTGNEVVGATGVPDGSAKNRVLILILLEMRLLVEDANPNSISYHVLILILLEMRLLEDLDKISNKIQIVLILILLEMRLLVFGWWFFKLCL